MLKSALVTLAAAAAIVGHARQTNAPADGLPRVPPGFVVERVAGPPLVDRPIVADFDEEGRLYVADSSGSNDPVQKQLAEKPHRIVRLEDKDGDGRFDSSVVFADRMMFPEGAMWFDGSLYVAAPPSIWKLTDTDGDGIADRREEWFQGKTLTNCANDLHGPYLGPDGWIYWTKGAFAEQTYERPGKPPLVTRASHIFRRRPGDALVESVMTGGMDNPVDVAFTTTGERILTATFLEHPQLGRRDALIHAVYGGVYGKPHAVLDGHLRTGDLLPGIANFGPSAPSGLTRYASRAFGEEYRDNFFAAQFNLHKITRHVLEPSGATFRSRDSDFLVSGSQDFHPTDVIEDADGSLLVVDTGAWYKLCCPTSQLAKPEVLGAIYRVRRRGAPRVADPRGRRLPWSTMTPAQLVARLHDDRPAVQTRAIARLASLGGESVPALERALETAPAASTRRNAVWALIHVENPRARDAVRRALRDRDTSVQHAAAHGIAVWRDRAASPALRQLLASPSAAIRRVAAEALGRVGDADAVPDLLASAEAAADPAAEHSIVYALVEIGDPAATARGLDARSARTKRVALIALDGMPAGGLQPAAIVALLDSAEPLLRETAWWIAARHPAWADELSAYFDGRLNAAALGDRERRDLQEKLTEFVDDPAIQRLLAAMAARDGSAHTRATALRVMAATRLRELPAAWIGPLVRALAAGDEAARLAVRVAGRAPAPKTAIAELRNALLATARASTLPLDLRIEALGAAAPGLAALDSDLFDLVRSALEPSRPASLRLAAAGVMERARLGRDQLRTLVEIVRTAGPLETPRLIGAFGQESDEAIGLALIAALESSAGRSNVRADVLRPRLAKYPESVQRRAEALLEASTADAARQARQLEALLANLKGGDRRRGQAVFNGPKGTCSTCHAIGYLGGRMGPDLTRIGEIRSERDLLEAVVFPSASFARGFEPVTVTTNSGAVHGGLLRSERPDEIVLTQGEGQDVRIRREDIEDIQPASISPMPAGYAELLTRAELADLLVFLKATRSGPQ
jgi:putative membrane-bound dehydrogenase-like protein